MIRKKDEQIFRKIWHELNREPQTIHQISQRTNINWETVKHTISVLDEIKLLKKDKTGKKTKYCSFKLNIDLRSKEEILSELRLKKLSGSGNKCNCGKTGEFGSIVLYEDQYLICGWCETIIFHQNKLRPRKNLKSPETMEVRR